MKIDFDERDKLLIGTFETELGRRYLAYLESFFVDRPMYEAGMSIDEVAFRQGQATLIRNIGKVLKGATNG